MALKNQNTRFFLNFSLLLFTLASLWLNPISALAMGNPAALPSFADFSKTVQNGQADLLRGVYVSDVMALPIVQQPAGKAGYVSSKDGETTQFRMASQFGNLGLLAHNHLAGKDFSNLAVGQEVIMVYGDGSVERFIVTEVLQRISQPE
jgi:hypothetical protein